MQNYKFNILLLVYLFCVTSSIAHETKPFDRFMVLNSGLRIPKVGFGTAGLRDATESTIHIALCAGFQMVDTAQAMEWYREAAVGNVLSSPQIQCPDSTIVNSSEVIIVTKLHPSNLGYKATMKSFESTLNNLQRKVVDVFLIHSPECWPGWNCSGRNIEGSWKDSWRAMEKLYHERKIKAIGVSNFDRVLMEQLWNFAEIPPALVQNWMDPFHQDIEVREFCREHGIGYMAFSTLGTQWSWRLPKNPVLTHPIIQDIAQSHGITPSIAVLTWALQSDTIIIPKSSNPTHIHEIAQNFIQSYAPFSIDTNQQIFSYRKFPALTNEEINLINSLDGQISLDAV